MQFRSDYDYIVIIMYFKGNTFKNDRKDGWIFGNFMEDGLQKDSRAEIKVATLDNNFISKPHYNKAATKLDIIWDGDAIWEIDGNDVPMTKGDYVIIPPKTTVCIKKVLSPKLVVQTIKIPSTPDDKVMV